MSWFRRHCNRALSLQMLAMLLVAMVWFSMQVLPGIPKPGEPELFFGEPHMARQSPLFGRVSFRVNGDNNATFVLWMNPNSREQFNLWFGPDQALRIDAVRTWGNEWMVVGLGSNVGDLNARDLFLWRMGWLLASTVALAIALSTWIWLMREYAAYFRHKSWFRNR